MPTPALMAPWELRSTFMDAGRPLTTRTSRSRRQTRIDTACITRDGNVIADLGLPNHEGRLAKAQLASLIDDVIRERGLTQHRAARLMGIDQPKGSHILHGRLAGFSTQRLMGILTGLGRDVGVTLAPGSRKCGREHVASECA